MGADDSIKEEGAAVYSIYFIQLMTIQCSPNVFNVPSIFLDTGDSMVN